MIHPDNSSENAAQFNRSTATIELQDDNNDASRSTSKTNQRPEVDDSIDIPIPIDQSIANDSEIKQRVKGTSAEAATEIIDDVLAANQGRDSVSSPHLSKADLIDDQLFGCPILEATLVEEGAAEEEKQGSIHIRIEPTGPVFDAVLVPNESEVQADNHEDDTGEKWPSKRQKSLIVTLVLVLVLIIGVVSATTILTKQKPIPPAEDVMDTPEEVNDTSVKEETTSTVWSTELTSPANDVWWTGSTSTEELIAETFTIEGLMWNDTNADGVHQPSEPFIANAFANLRTCDDDWIQTAWSGEDGHYQFEGVEEVHYYVQFLLPSRRYKFSKDLPSGKSRCQKVYSSQSIDMGYVDRGDIKHEVESILRRNITIDALNQSDSRSKAFNWLLSDDPAELSAFDPRLRQRYILALLAFEFGDAPSSDWLSGEHECLWDNIECASGGGEVTALELAGPNVHGTIPPEIAGLTSLQTLAFDNTSLTGSLSAELGELQSLVWLSLTNNSLSGTIPSALGALQSLGWLDLSYNNFTGTLPSELMELKSLEYFFLSENVISGTLPLEIGKLTELVKLWLDVNEFNGTIPSPLGALQSLHQLYLDNNTFTGTLPLELTDLTSLEELYLSLNALTGTLPSEIGKLTYLEGLRLDGNEFNGTLPLTLGGLQALEFLILGGNEFNGTIPSSLGALESLEWLDLGYNNFTGKLPPEIGQLTELEYLYLNYNNLTGTLPSELQAMTQLSELWIESNGFTGTLPQWIGEFEHLTSLDVRNNNFTGAFPLEIMSKLNNLTDLCVKGNNFTGQIPMEIETYYNCTDV